MSAMRSLDDARLTVGGNAPVMTKRLRAEGVSVLLGAQLSPELRLQIDPDVTGTSILKLVRLKVVFFSLCFICLYFVILFCDLLKNY